MRGPLYPAGGSADIVHKHLSNTNVTMELGLPDRSQGHSGRTVVEFSSDEPQLPRLARVHVESRGSPSLEITRAVEGEVHTSYT